MLWVLIRIASVYSLESPHLGNSNEYPQHVFMEYWQKLSSNTLLICSTEMWKWEKEGAPPGERAVQLVLANSFLECNDSIRMSMWEEQTCILHK